MPWPLPSKIASGFEPAREEGYAPPMATRETCPEAWAEAVGCRLGDSAGSEEDRCVGLAGRASEDGDLDNFKDGGPIWHQRVHCGGSEAAC